MNEWFSLGEATATPLPSPKPAPPAAEPQQKPADKIETLQDFTAWIPAKSLKSLTDGPTGLPDGLNLASELYLAFEDRGYKVALASDGQATRRVEVDHRGCKAEFDYYTRERWSPSRPTVGVLGPLAVGLTIYELSDEVEMRYHNGDWIPASDPRPQGRQSHGWAD